MAFPISPTNGQTAIVNNVYYSYVSATNTWSKLVGSVPNLANITVTGQATVGNLQTTSGVFWSNGSAYSSGGGGGGGTSTTAATPPSSPNVGDIWYNTGNDTLYRWTFDGTTNYWLDMSGSSISTTATEDPLHPFLLMGA